LEPSRRLGKVSRPASLGCVFRKSQRFGAFVPWKSLALEYAGHTGKTAAHVGEEFFDHLKTNIELQEVRISNESDSLRNHIMVLQLFA
jgi:hypothetical protein